jgi:dolichol-phosphate mannosyltransferase
MVPRRATPRYSIVIPLFNEAEVLPALLARMDSLLGGLDGPAEVIFVDDGSADSTAAQVRAKAAADSRYRLVELSRNFGHQAAITAGMDVAAGQAVIVMDADLQDPPEVVYDLAAKWREGFQVVYAQRTSREGETAFKRWTAHLFYQGLRRVASIDLLPNVGDFRLVDRKVLDAFRAMPERDRFVRGMFGWLGFRQAVVPFARAPRAAGTTKYPLWKMIRLAVGMTVSTLALIYGAYVLIAALGGDRSLVAGWASTIVIVSFLCGLNMMLTGVVGLYVGRIHAEVKGRPLYVVNDKVGFDCASPEAAAPQSVSEQQERLARYAAG